MRRATLSVVVFALAATVLSTGAFAAVYTVKLANGASFDSRYQPQRASWDADKVVLLTEYGNQIAFPASDIEAVTIDTDAKGFGHQLDATTIALGWAPNDAIDPNTEEGQAMLAAEAQAAASAASAPPVYNQQQFVEPVSTTGMPVWMTGYDAVPQVAPPMLVPQAPPIGNVSPP
jgi:hypothetical protein